MDQTQPPSSSPLLQTLGQEILPILYPVSSCMLLVILLVSSLSPSPSPSPIPALAFPESPADSLPSKLSAALLTSLVFIAAVTALTFLLLLLFYLRCAPCLRSYTALSSFAVLAFLGGDVSLLLLARLALPLDAPSFLLLLFNFSVVGTLSIFLVKTPIVVTQGYLVVIGVLVAYWFTLLPEWTTWALLVSMALYDLAAVLLPVGPLRLLVELATSRDEEIPALVYEARPLAPQAPGGRVWREVERPSVRIAVEGSSEGEGSVSPLAAREGGRGRIEEGGIGLGSSGAIKLGLGDFIFYSVLVGRAALYDFMTVYACYLAIVSGLVVTLLLLAVYRKALPALPVSIALGVLFYFLTRVLLEVFLVQCSVNLLMF